MTVTYKDVERAALLLKGVAVDTPVAEAAFFSKKFGNSVFLKLENLQVTGSFKARGTYIKLCSLSSKEKEKGVIAMSAGNHAQGVAHHAQSLGINSLIIMPEGTPLIKVEQTLQYGAEVLLKVDPIYVDRKTYENFELALKSLVKITEFLHMKRCVRLHVSVWNSNDKVYLFADFLGVHLEQEMASNGHLANKLLQMENLMAPHNAIVKLLSFGNKNKTRLVLNFNPSLHGRKRVEITQQSA